MREIALNINKILFFCAICLSVFLPLNLGGQASAWNPFDIKTRDQAWVDSVRNSEISPIAASNVEDEAEIPFVDTVVENEKIGSYVLPVVLEEQEEKNPFEFKKTDVNQEDWEPLTQLPRSSRSDADMLFVVLVLLTITTGALIALHRNFVLQIFRAILSSNHMYMLQRSVNTSITNSVYLFYGLFCISGGVFLYLILDTLQMALWQEGFALLFFCILLVSLTYAAKHWLLRFLGWAFDMEKSVLDYLFTIAVFNSAIGILLLPFIALLSFGPDNLLNVLTYISLLLFGLLLLWRQVRVFITSLHKLLPFAFHFFIYLCAVEIAPVLLLLVVMRVAI